MVRCRPGVADVLAASFYGLADPPQLHSFPTRRSSDLNALSRARASVGALAPPASSTAPTREARRSEEHTSELQSLRHLVCRLLLEKKKAPAPPMQAPNRGEPGMRARRNGRLLTRPGPA